MTPLNPPKGPRVTDTEPRIAVKRSPMTYERDGRASYFRDLTQDQNPEARERLVRHAREVAVEMERRQTTLPAGFEARVDPNRTDGQGGYFSPPLWLIEQFATAKRPGRVLSDLIKEAGGWFPLPAGVSSINLPRLTTGAAVNNEADLQGDDDQDAVDTFATSALVTVSGHADVAMQLLEQSPSTAALDWAIWTDMTEAYDADLETQLLSGTGTANSQLVGLTNLSGINSVTYTDASPTLAEMWTYLGQAVSQIGDNRDLPPEVWLMRTARWGWMFSAEDNNARPIVPPKTSPMGPPPAGVPNVTGIGGFPVFLDDAIPANLGTGANQDQIIACRPSDLLLLEGTPITDVSTEVLSGTLEARIRIRNYVAFIGGRYPTGVSVIGGTGFVVQAGE